MNEDRYFSNNEALSNWYSPTNVSVEIGTEQDCGTDLHI